MKLVLLHSPLVACGTWRMLAPVLRARGFEVAVADYAAKMAGPPPYYPKLIESARAAIVPGDRTILVAHSGAGALIPALADLASGAIFMDALLPHPGKSWFETAPESLNARLVRMVKDGRVQPWHLWWPKGAIEALFPDADSFERFASDLHDLPLIYFEENAPDIALPAGFPCAYLQLGPGGEAEAGVAEKLGWPVRRRALHHLAMLTHPVEIACEIEQLVRSLSPR